ncbi:probable Cell cycle serine/threonine-protein kinase CDC5/MSD2 [Saccharomycodes ludwigii]|uniref:Serine/threonine-protein kinase n=1 Tax=Saccharomycodes ludwigii TaxID=36035 RepID=A0A376BD58_9ASCO|nr:hypothetical protein SCDLUD_000932 [Saccharomycodes ludwigii]KAH3903307.1 hypothetical protein SCDLUD_000932 [Saccharomycodes ludwigii]SSD62060.1 probable Cell cycle serine/threonine-protein kinase CDC5/MSD2 [Saccharomycodes ludwigii]
MSQQQPPLQIVNDKQLNTRSNNVRTPIKNNIGKENYHTQQHSNKRSDHHLEQHRQPAQKKKKEKLSSLCKTPPSLIKMKGRDYHRGPFLGEGGFARCFQMKDDNGKIFAAKTVAKLSIKSDKTKRKLLSEIQIHKSMRHPNIVQFIDCFEDDVNVYILLEICPNGSLMDLLKKRKVITEPEARYFTTQIVGGVKYMHSRRVIHRDLKLGNIFFDSEYNLKIGDFGLAAVLSSERERKYTVCGTPNYIAPEVLTGKHTGHSFEVDIWSIGIMIYAMLIGKPPFQSKDVNKIYQRIKTGDYYFPDDRPITSEAELLIKDILAINPLERPSLNEIMDSVWFRGFFPAAIEKDVMDKVPLYDKHLDPTESLNNFKNCMAKAGILTHNRARESPVHLSASASETGDNINKYDNNLYILPHCLSPGDTKTKYKEVVDIETQRRLNSLARDARINKARQIMIRSNLVSASTNHINSDLSLRILASECHMTLNGLLKCEAEKNLVHLTSSDDLHDERLKHPIIVTKWVDYSNKHGFSYQLSTDDIGVLFNNGCTVLRLADAEEFWYINSDEKDGWVATHYSLADRHVEFHKHLEVVNFFSKYMKTNLSRVSTFIRELYHTEDVFLRRYTRYNQYVMFELSDGTFQFNFKDHHKFVVSESGNLITYISPERENTTYETVKLLKYGSVPKHPDINIKEKVELMKEGLKQKAMVVSRSQQ